MKKKTKKEIVEEFIKDELTRGKVDVTIVGLGKDKKFRSKLTFNEDGKFRGLTSGVVSINNYIERILRFTKKDVMISVNGIPLTEIKEKEIKLLEHMTYNSN